MKFSNFSVVVGLVGLSAGAFGQSYELKWKPKVGEIHQYAVSVKFDYGEAVLQYSSLLKTKVLAIEKDGSYSVETTTTGATFESGDQKTDPAAQPPVIQYFSRNGLPTGASLKDHEPDPFSDLLDHLTEFQAPVMGAKLGDTWLNRPVGPKTGLFGEARMSYKLTGLPVEGIRRLAKVDYKAAIGSDPEAATGSVTLNLKNNSLVGMNATIPHFRPDGAAEEAAVTVTVREKDAS